MGVKYTELPAASEVTSQDIIAVLDASDNTLKKASINQLPGGSGGGGAASDITYDNTDSGLQATNVQDAIDELSIDIPGIFIIKGQTLSFTNNVATVSNANVKESTCTLVYYTEGTGQAAQNAGITVETNTGQVVFTAANTPSGTITCDIICIDRDKIPSVPTGYDNFVIKNQTLSFVNKVATVSNANVTAATYATIYYTDSTIAAARAAGISAQTTAGAIVFNCTSANPGTITCDIVCTNVQ